MAETKTINSNLTVLSLLGEGAFGKVHKCLYKKGNFEKVVAVKTLKNQNFNENQKSEFLKEAHNVAKLNHPNICQVLDVGEDFEGNPLIIYEYLEGKNLREVINNYSIKKLSENEAFEIYKNILNGLNYAHSQGIIHHDVNPNNIILTDHGQIKIIDFGLSKFESGNQTIDGSISGTANYYDPYLLKNKLPYDKAADIFSASLIFYELLTGNKLFSSPSIIEVIDQIKNFKNLSKEDLEDIKSNKYQDLLKNVLNANRKKRKLSITNLQADPVNINTQTIKNKKLTSTIKKRNYWFLLLLPLITISFFLFNKEKKNVDFILQTPSKNIKASLDSNVDSYLNGTYFSSKVCNFMLASVYTYSLLLDKNNALKTKEKIDLEVKNKVNNLAAYEKAIRFINNHKENCHREMERTIILKINQFDNQLRQDHGFETSEKYYDKINEEKYISRLLVFLSKFITDNIYIGFSDALNNIVNYGGYIKSYPGITHNIFKLDKSFGDLTPELCSDISSILYIATFIPDVNYQYDQEKKYEQNLIIIEDYFNNHLFEIVGSDKESGTPVFKVEDPLESIEKTWCISRIHEGKINIKFGILNIN